MAGLNRKVSADNRNKIGVFGGSFDPPHYGHLILAAEALQALHLERVLWVLTPNPPHKTGRILTSLDIRLRLVQACIQGDPAFELSTVDIDRPPPHYAVDTLHLLQASHPLGDFFYIMGGDSLRDLPSWYAPADFVAACAGLGVLRREGDNLEHASLLDTPALKEKVHFFSAPRIEISSSDIRSRVASGRNFRYMLPSAVYHVIVESGIYR
jgi:nicotinate-nucleotide adenylyltransferase